MGIVYFAREPGSDEFKIGHTKDSVATPRLTGLKRRGRPTPVLFRKIETDCFLDVEKYLHRKLAASTTDSGKEWFAITEAAAIVAHEDGVRIAGIFERHQRELAPFALLASTSGEALEASPDLKSLCTLIKQKTSQLELLKTEVELLRTDLKIAIGVNDGIKDLATWHVGSVTTLDRERLELEMPEIYEQFRVTKLSRRLLVK